MAGQSRRSPQPTKQGWLFVFDRVTGEPVWPIEERPVAASDVPGERLSPTQPFPTKPPAFDEQGFGPDDLIDFTPELRAEAEQIISRYRIGPMYTPPSVADADGTLGHTDDADDDRRRQLGRGITRPEKPGSSTSTRRPSWARTGSSVTPSGRTWISLEGALRV